MAQYADLIVNTVLLTTLRNSAGRDQLSQSDVDELLGLVLRIADEAGPLLARIPSTFIQYTEHDITHSRNLVDLCGRFIPQTTLARLNAIELAILAIAILTHDFGMFVSEDEKVAMLSAPSFSGFLNVDIERVELINAAYARGADREAEYLRDAALAEFFRRVHPERAGANIRAYLTTPLVYRDLDLFPFIATLAESHGWGVHEPANISQPDKLVRNLHTQDAIYGAPVNTQYLACCLRLADILDFDRSRTPMAVFRALTFSEERSRTEWHKHLQVVGWLVSATQLSYSAECTHPAYYVAVNEFLDYVDREIQDCHRLIIRSPADVSNRYELQLPLVVDRSRVVMADRRFVAGGYRFELDYERIMALLMDRSLYGDPSLFLRELIQNAADACRYAAALARASTVAYEPRIVVKEEIHSGQQRLTVTDNGIGMPLHVLIEYFMRVGRSYYRSPSFLAVKSQLASSGVLLDATSQFGIGILSCFMVTDVLEVATYRRGNAPLRVTVDGPTKYFVIEQLSEPGRSDFDQSMPDGDPPEVPGTAVSVTVSKVQAIDLEAVLGSTAANLDFDITVISASGEEKTLARDGWQKAPSANDLTAALYTSQDFYRFFTPNWQLSETFATDCHPTVRDVLVPSIVEFSKHEATRSYRGAAWLWLLRGVDGKPAPARGYLRISWSDREGLSLRGVPRLVADVLHETVSAKVGYRELGRVGSDLLKQLDQDVFGHSVASRLIQLIEDRDDEDQDPECLVEDFSSEWSELSAVDRALFGTCLESLANRAENWHRIDGLTERLLTGDTTWATDGVDFTGDLRFTNLPQAYAMFGMALPGGILRWDARAGFARKVRLVAGPVGLKVDFRGSSAPRPAANRLFVEAGDAAKGAVAIIRAILRHAAELTATGNSRAWQSWFRRLIASSSGLPFWRAAIAREIDVIEAVPVYSVRDDYLTGSAIRERFGRWPRIETENSRDVDFHTYDGINGRLLQVRPHSRKKGEARVDMESLLPDEALSVESFPIGNL